MFRKNARRAPIWAASAVLCLSLAAAYQTASAQRAAGLNDGRRLAEKLCVSCHIVGADTSNTVNADVPGFVTIANRPNQSAERIAGRLISPHPPMPRISLTRDEIRHLAAYIMSLRK